MNVLTKMWNILLKIVLANILLVPSLFICYPRIDLISKYKINLIA